MQHDTVTEKISLWFDDELNPAEITELQHHLAECPACLHTYQAMQRVHHLFQTASRLLVEPAPGFVARFETRLAYHRPHGRGHMWLGLGVLLLGTLVFFCIGMAMGGAALVGAGSNLLQVSTLFYGLGLVSEVVDQTQLYLNLAGLGLSVALLTMRQPVFWGLVLLAIALAGLWVRLMRQIYRRASPAPVMVELFI
ncbi:MAG: zf-HC2 domain-containing protein [Chloroflexota bacterium]